MRIVLALAIFALLSVASSERARDRVGDTLGVGQAAAPRGLAGDAPPEYRQILSTFDSAASAGGLRERAGVLPGVFGTGPRSSGAAGGEAAGPRPFADVGAPREVARVKRDIRAGLRRVSAVTGRAAPDPARAAAALERVYSGRVLDATAAEARVALPRRLAGVGARAPQRVRVAAFHGVFVAGTRAVAVLDYARAIRDAAGGGGWRQLPLERWEVALRRESGRWRFERGLER